MDALGSRLRALAGGSTVMNAFFLPLGVPYANSGDVQKYSLKSSVSSIGDLFIDFRDGKTGNPSKVQAWIGYQTVTPSKSILGNYRATSAIVVLDDSAKIILRQRLRQRVATIKDFIDDKNRYSAPVEAKAAFEKDRAIYLGKIESCRLEGDPDLTLVVDEEAEKLKAGFPGITVWEKQIGDANAKPSRVQTLRTKR